MPLDFNGRIDVLVVVVTEPDPLPVCMDPFRFQSGVLRANASSVLVVARVSLKDFIHVNRLDSFHLRNFRHAEWLVDVLGLNASELILSFDDVRMIVRRD